MKTHLDENEEGLELVSRRAAEVGKFPFFLETQDAELDKAANGGLFVASSSRLDLKDGQAAELKFYYSDGNSIKIEKAFVFTGGVYNFDVQISVWKEGRKVEPRIIWGPGIGNPVVTSRRQQFGIGSGVAVLAANRVYRINDRKYRPEASSFNFANWAAYEGNYMTALFCHSAPPRNGPIPAGSHRRKKRGILSLRERSAKGLYRPKGLRPSPRVWARSQKGHEFRFLRFDHGDPSHLNQGHP